MTGISMLETDALPHVKLNLAILAQILKMFNLFALRFVVTETYRVHNLKFVMTGTTQEETDVQRLAKLSQGGNVLVLKDKLVFAINFYAVTLDFKQAIQRLVMTETLLLAMGAQLLVQ